VRINFFIKLIFIILIGYGIYEYRGNIKQFVASIFFQNVNTIWPCQQTVYYSLGSVDSRFKMATSTLLTNIYKAADLWNKEADKKLFEYKDGANLKVNLIYDYRQEATDKQKALDAKINANKSTFEAQKARYESLLAEHNRQKAVIDGLLATLERDKAYFTQQTDYWNKKGGAPSGEYQKLVELRDSINSQIANINTLQTKYNADVAELNTLGAAVNQQVKDINKSIINYNNVGVEVGSEFREGEFVSQAGKQEINIYEFGSPTLLIRVLSHEFGHALNLDHVTEKGSIMYNTNNGTTATLSKADIAELQRVCGTSTAESSLEY
jgi:chromosome segregation ATPase